jgi:FMN phosphatase YigB (HAD superfamily)/GTP cyclohydrolase II
MMNKVALHFNNEQEPRLSMVSFVSSTDPAEMLSVRGKTGGAFDTKRTFQWTSAVQGLAIVLLKACTSPEKPDPNSKHSILAGNQGSIAASLDYAIDKQPAWLLDMFGILPNGQTILRRLIRRSNSGRKMSGPVLLSVNKDFLAPTNIQIFVDDQLIADETARLSLLNRMQEKYDKHVLDLPSSHEKDEPIALRDDPTEQVVQRLFKTPSIPQYTSAGRTFMRLYQDGEISAFLVSRFDLSETSNVKNILVRIQFSSLPATLLGTLSSDCRQQIAAATERMSSSNLIIIHLVCPQSQSDVFHRFVSNSNANSAIPDPMGIHGGSPTLAASENKALVLAGNIIRDLKIEDFILWTSSERKIKAFRDCGFKFQVASCEIFATPQNLPHLCTKHSPQVIAANLSRAGSFYCEAENGLSRERRTWIFGGDDTLWEDNIYYEDYIRRFIDHICGASTALSRSDVREIVDRSSKLCIAEYGYGPRTFEKTLQTAFKRVQERLGNSGCPVYPAEIIDNAAISLTHIPVRVTPDAEKTLIEIARRGEQAVLFTQGPIEAQLWKISQLRISSLFDAIAIVPSKIDSSVNQLIEQLGVELKQLVFVGNNTVSDIQPAIQLGLCSILFTNPNSWSFLNPPLAGLTAQYEVRQLTQIFDIFAPVYAKVAV